MIVTLLTTILLGQGPTLGVSIDGDGYLRFGDRGRVVYSKEAKLTVNESGRLAHTSGQVLLPSVEVPANTERLGSDLEGHISATIRGEKRIIGRIVLAYFESEPTLTKQGEFLIARSRPQLLDPGERMAGVVRVQGGNDVSPARTEPSNTPPQTQPVATGLIRIEISETVMTSADRIKLGDIATISAKEAEFARLREIDLGTTPQPGIPLRISRETILYQVKRLGYNTATLDLKSPQTITVHREGQIITQAQFLEAAIKFVQERLGVAIPLSGDSAGPDFHAPKGVLQLRMESMSPKDAQMQVVMAVFVDGKRLNSRTIKLDGEGLTAGVKAGQLVKVRFITSGYVAEISGRSRQNGMLGQTVEVTVQYDGPGSTTSHAATVVGNGIVEVKL
ncbi:MAG: hypothetical protein KF784_12620 [Fimbriimonadaceae bacterium]|nr:hypothetical protein [Fimbriimonadaceae bacterium]